MKNKLNKRVLHEIQKRDGFFDGRFRNRVIQNKKKEASKRACRVVDFILLEDEFDFDDLEEFENW